MSKYNDIDMTKWHSYDNIYTDSLWIINKRDNSGLHSGHYHGNFIPQIPYQLFSRYTKANDWILDPFMGSGTSIIEALRINRNAIGIELQQNIADEVSRKLKNITTNNKFAIFNDNSLTIDINQIKDNLNINNVQFIIFHPPYWDIIKFSDNRFDLSNANSVESFLTSFDKIIDNTTQLLENNRYCALVMGDKYANSQIIPLGYLCMNLFISRNFKLKAIIVKNFDETRAKANSKAIWRYRALASDFYLFKHEYIFIFKKLNK